MKSLLVLILFFISLPAFAVEHFTTKKRFEISIGAPSSIEYCKGILWAYSIEDQKIWRINPTSGAKEGDFRPADFGVSGFVTAIGCNSEFLIFATYFKEGKIKPKAFLYQMPIGTGPIKSIQVRYIPIPGEGIVRDVFCGFDKCYILRDKIYESDKSFSWRETPVPPSGAIQRSRGKKTVTNPFYDWQDKYVLAQGRYFRGLVLPDQTPLFLD